MLQRWRKKYDQLRAVLSESNGVVKPVEELQWSPVLNATDKWRDEERESVSAAIKRSFVTHTRAVH